MAVGRPRVYLSRINERPDVSFLTRDTAQRKRMAHAGMM